MRTCIITGAGTGIGRATALSLARHEDIDNFVLISMGTDYLEETKRLINQYSVSKKNILLYDQDLTEYDQVKSIIEDVYQKCGQIDILLNIAGYSKECFLQDISMELFERTFKINVFAMFVITQAVAEYMKKSGGVIVNVASTSGSTPRPGWLPYAASKAAVISMSKTLTEELKDDGIRVFNVSPGRCATTMRKGLRPDENADMIMQPTEVADVISYFVKHPSCNIDGQDIIVRKLD